MNTYVKFAPNVFVAKCEEQYEKGEVIEVTTKYGKENECIDRCNDANKRICIYRQHSQAYTFRLENFYTFLAIYPLLLSYSYS